MPHTTVLFCPNSAKARANVAPPLTRTTYLSPSAGRKPFATRTPSRAVPLYFALLYRPTGSASHATSNGANETKRNEPKRTEASGVAQKAGPRRLPSRTTVRAEEKYRLTPVGERKPSISRSGTEADDRESRPAPYIDTISVRLACFGAAETYST